MLQKEVNKILEEANLDFKITDKTFYANFIYSFADFTEPIYGYTVTITKNNNEYWFRNFTEAMFWYRYYTCKRHNLTLNPEVGYSNTSYFSRLPSHYRNTPSNKGLNIVKEALTEFIQLYHGIPKNYSEEELDKICYIK